MKKHINLKHEKWITRFDKMTERTIFFYLTIAMLTLGMYHKLGSLW
jgi:hypothetical protein